MFYWKGDYPLRKRFLRRSPLVGKAIFCDTILGVTGFSLKCKNSILSTQGQTTSKGTRYCHFNSLAAGPGITWQLSTTPTSLDPKILSPLTKELVTEQTDGLWSLSLATCLCPVFTHIFRLSSHPTLTYGTLCPPPQISSPNWPASLCRLTTIITLGVALINSCPPPAAGTGGWAHAHFRSQVLKSSLIFDISSIYKKHLIRMV